MIKTVQSDKAPAAIGPYSQAISANGFIFCSGQIGVNPKTGDLVEGLEEQVKQGIKNLQAVLRAAGSDLTYVVKTTVFLKNMSDFPAMNAIYSEFFVQQKPARATIEVSKLPKGALFEIEAIAVIKL